MPFSWLARALPDEQRDDPSPPLPPAEFAPLSESFQTELLPLAGPGDALAPGVAVAIAREVCMSVAVTNYGSVDLIVNAGEPTDHPKLVGPGAALVPPGGFAMLTLPGKFHSFYGRPGELVGVTRFPAWEPGTVSTISAGLWLPVDLGIVGGSIAPAYTTPWGTRAVYGGFTARETVGASPVAFRLHDGGIGGTVLEDVNLGGGGSTEEDTTMSTCAASSISVEFLGGGGTLRLTLRVR
jgi:hypothetical protein